jgi:hypothetical protein
LVDDDLVHCEKIGTSNYYWAFPSEAAVKLDTQIAAQEKRLNVGAGLAACSGRPASQKLACHALFFVWRDQEG